jgi:hypothetical protein
VRNNTLGAGDNTGQFITFTRRGCYDSDKNGMQAGDGFFAYQGIDNDVHVYEGDTYWGKAFYYFTRDFNKYNVRAPDGVIYVYERATAPASALTSSIEEFHTERSLKNPPVNVKLSAMHGFLAVSDTVSDRL